MAREDASGYEEYRKRQAKISSDRSAAGRDIEIPDVVDPDRKALCRDDLELFAVTYFPQRFPLPFADVHREVIRAIQVAVLDKQGQDNLLALAFMRGGGKTTIAEVAVIWAVVYGHRRFPVLVQATTPLASRSLKKIRSEFESNVTLAEDFPEVCEPIRRLERIHNRARGQTANGEPTNIEIGAEGIVLPTIVGSACSGSAIHVAGITSALKGLSMAGPGGEIMRPDFVLIDDAQTRESAKSPTQTADRESIIVDDVLNLAGPGRSIAAVFVCTPIFVNDLPERFLNRENHPEWVGLRTSMLTSMPKNLTLWDEYAELRRNGLRDGNGTEEAAAFYLANRPAMEEGAIASWPARLSAGAVTATSAIELAMILHYQNPKGFAAEYQCKPSQDDLGAGAKELIPAVLSARLNGVERLMIPAESTRLTAFIDCGVNVHWYCITAWNESYGGAVVDYGCWPRQNRSFFESDDARPKLADLYPGMTPSQLVFRGLDDLSNEILGRSYFRQGGGELRIERCLVDSGYETKSVYQWVRQSPFVGTIYPSKGFSRTLTARGISEWKPRPGERSGFHWRLTMGEEHRIKCVQFDPDAWKSFLYGSLTTPPGGMNGIFFYGRAASAHEMLSHHLSAEYSTAATIRGTTFDKWQIRSGHVDNHLLDCLLGSAVAVSVQGLQWHAGALAGQAVADQSLSVKRTVSDVRKHIVPGRKHIGVGTR
jgi:hypothetical protein